jgi:Uma2 family endonuclease
MGTTTLLSFEEFEHLPDEPGKVELLDGELIQLPPAKRKHTELSHRIQALLMHAAGNMHKTEISARLGRVYLEAGYKFGSRAWLQPDVSIPYSDQPGGDYFESAPALAIEVISESNTAAQMDRKRKIYLTNGAIEVWLVYPDTRCVLVYSEGHVEEFQTVLRSTLLPGLEIDLDQLFD